MNQHLSADLAVRNSCDERCKIKVHSDTSSCMLCTRCKALELDKYVSPWSWDNVNLLASITAVSIQESCVLCRLFCNCLEAIRAGDIEAERSYSRSGFHEQSDDCSVKNEIFLHVHHNVEETWEHGRNWMMTSFTISLAGKADRNIWLYPMGSPATAHDGVSYGTGVVIDPQTADLTRAKTWISLCEDSHSEHPSRCKPATLSLKRALKVIDCHTRQVRDLQAGETYSCLSYVWGKPTASDVPTLRLPGKLAKTIEDAILVTLALDIPRIWIDQYCINQSDLDEKMETIAAMDQIYRSAELTIVAASGDSSSGLFGVRGKSRRKQDFINVGRTTFMIGGDICHQINSSTWNSRAWTFQEGLLASRRLIFTDTQMYFQCAEMHCLEYLSDGFNHPAVSNDRDLRVFPGIGTGHSLNTIYNLLQQYFPRHLSYGSDSINAFEGVLNAIAKDMKDTRLKHFFGLPIFYYRRDSSYGLKDFASLLLWRTLRVSQHSQVPVQPALFPSWTWAAHKGANPTTTNHILMNHIMKGMLYQQDIKFQIEHLSGRKADLVDLPSVFKLDRYIDFQPWIYVTTQTARVSLSIDSQKDPVAVPHILRSDRETVWLDHHPYEAGEAIAMFFGILHVQETPTMAGALIPSENERDVRTVQSSPIDQHEDYLKIECLLVRQKLNSDGYYRIGLWSIKIEYTPVSAEDALQHLEGMNSSGLNCRWEERTLRLV